MVTIATRKRKNPFYTFARGRSVAFYVNCIRYITRANGTFDFNPEMHSAQIRVNKLHFTPYFSPFIPAMDKRNNRTRKIIWEHWKSDEVKIYQPSVALNAFNEGSRMTSSDFIPS